MRNVVNVTAFIDWNSQIHAARPGRNVSEAVIAQRTLEYVGQILGNHLSKQDATARFSVTLRLYHGWHKGFQVMPRRKAIRTVVAGADFGLLSTKATVTIRPNIEYGDLLISGQQTRLHPMLGCHLANTLRATIEDPNVHEEKMVDTAIAADLVDLSFRDPERWLIVVGEDDDLVPPIIVAEGTRSKNDGKIFLLRKRPVTNFLKLEGLCVVI